jgi:hypothetical protein
MFAFVMYVRMQSWWAHNNLPFAILSGVGLALFALPLLVFVSKLTGAFGDLADRLTDRLDLEVICRPIAGRLGVYLIRLGGRGCGSRVLHSEAQVFGSGFTKKR